MNNTDELAQYRAEIDLIDGQILDLLAKRIEVVKKVGLYKKEHQIPALDQARWQQVLDKLASKATEKNLDLELVKDLWNRLHQYTVSLEEEV